ncbi:MAG: lytic transglycosylase domain-containing protein [Myxococcota bacterium]
MRGLAVQVLVCLALGLALLNGLVRAIGGGSPALLSPLFLEEKLIALGRLGTHYAWHPIRGCVPPSEDALEAAAAKERLPISLVISIAEVESGLASHRISAAGAMGLMQLMPETADRLRVRDPFDAKESAIAGTHFLAELWRRYHGDRRRVIAAYNAGPGAVPVSGTYTLPRETREYVARVESRLSRRGQTPP